MHNYALTIPCSSKPKVFHPLSQYLYETLTVYVVKNNKHVMHDLKMKLLEMEAVMTGKELMGKMYY